MLWFFATLAAGFAALVAAEWRDMRHAEPWSPGVPAVAVRIDGVAWCVLHQGVTRGGNRCDRAHADPDHVPCMLRGLVYECER